MIFPDLIMMKLQKSESKVIPILCDRSVKTFVSIVSLIMQEKLFVQFQKNFQHLELKSLLKELIQIL